MHIYMALSTSAQSAYIGILNGEHLSTSKKNIQLPQIKFESNQCEFIQIWKYKAVLGLRL